MREDAILGHYLLPFRRHLFKTHCLTSIGCVCRRMPRTTFLLLFKKPKLNLTPNLILWAQFNFSFHTKPPYPCKFFANDIPLSILHCIRLISSRQLIYKRRFKSNLSTLHFPSRFPSFSSRQPVAEWGFKQAARLRDKHKILVEELVICEDGSQAMRRMDFNAIAVELDSARETADAVRLECTNHYERTLDVSKRGPRAGDVWQLALSDYNLVQRFYAMGKARARARKLKEDLEELVPAAEVMATRIHALASETVGVVAEAQEMVREFDPLDDDINGYMRPEGDLGIFADLKRSSKAWTEFVAFYDGLVAEMMRRRAVLAKRSALVEQYKKALDDTYDEEMEIRTRFEEQFTRPEVPAIWRLCDPIAEPTTKFDIKPYPILTIIPDLTDHIADREVMRENARRIADTKLQPMIVNHLVTFAETDPRYHQQILQQQMQQQQYELYQQQIRAYQLQQAQNAQSSPLDASRQVYQPSFQYEPRPIASPSQSPARHAHRSAISSSNVDLTASDLAATSLSSSYAQQHQFHHMRSHPQPHTASSSAPLDASSNSLLDSRLSITESMLGDSNAIFHSASDHFATSSSTRPSGPPQ